MRTWSSRTYDSYSPRQPTRRHAWPPPPTVEDEPESEWKADNGEPPVNTRGALDQESLLDDIPQALDDQRFVLLSKQSTNENSRLRVDGARDRRRSIAQRGNMAYIQTDVDEPLVFPERVSTPYAYSKPHKESIAPSPVKNVPDVFDDSDLESEDTSLLRAERKPARYSFVKSDLRKDDFRTNTRDTQTRPETTRHDSGQRPSPHTASQKSRPSPADSPYVSSSRASSRPSSPLPGIPPKLVTRESSPGSRPSSRGHTRPTSPAYASPSIKTPSRGRVQASEADRLSTYPPASDRDIPLRYTRHDTMPDHTPRISVKSPSPARPPQNGTAALPYPVNDHHTRAFMPPEEHYQFDHSTVASPRQAYPDSPKVTTSSIPSSPHLRDSTFYSSRHTNSMPDESNYVQRSRSSSLRSQPNQNTPREIPIKRSSSDLDKPLPSCPRSTPSDRHDDWYSLQGYQSFDICPSCYDGVFANTPFAVHFSQPRRYQRPIERFCDFSNPWMRLAWLLTIKQRRPSLDLLYSLADIAENDRPCPEDREVGIDRITWFGIADQRDGVHVANFAVCSCDWKMIEALFPTMHGYFTKLQPNRWTNGPERYVCSLRTSSRRFPKYLDLLVELDSEAQSSSHAPNISRFIQLARDNAFKGECGKDKSSVRKPWHFIPSLPEFTVCEECYELHVWPGIQSKSASSPSSIPRLFNKAIQLVPGEEADVGSSCCLYSPRMRRVWNASVQNEDFTYLKKKAVERKRAESRLVRERKGIVNWMMGTERGSSQWDRARSELKELEKEWAAWE